VVSIVGHVEANGARIERVELVAADGSVIPLGYDCRRDIFTGTYPVPEGRRSGLLAHQVWIVLADGHRSAGPFAQVTVDSEASEPRPAPLHVPWTQPKVDEIFEQDLGLPVAEVGSGYVLFDLRFLRSRIRPGVQSTRDGRPI
jgi:hypothetical protein